MKEKLLKLWNKIADAGSVSLGCSFAAVLFFGIVVGIVFLLKWLWSLTWVKNAASNVGGFIVEHGTFLEYFFVGAFLIYLSVCLVLGIITLIRDNRRSIVNGVKTAWNWFLKSIFILILIAFCLFCLHECFHNSSDIEPQLYEHRM